MGKKHFTEEQIAFALRQAESGTAVTEFARETGDQAIANHDAVYAKGVRMMNSPLARAFDISAVPESVRRDYGESDFARGCLMARRLVETGVPFVEVTLDGWDTHYDNFAAVGNLCRDLDPAFSALLRDLRARDRLNDPLVICLGEFGRTPKISAAEGRDHWPGAWSAVLAGGGVRAGQVYGATAADGAKVVKDSITVPNFFAMLAALLRIDPALEVQSPVGRPIAISDGGKPVNQLIA